MDSKKNCKFGVMSYERHVQAVTEAQTNGIAEQ